MEHIPTKALPPELILKYLLREYELPQEKLIVYQKDLNLAINALRDDMTESYHAMKQLTTLLSTVIVFPSEKYMPTVEDIKKVRGETNDTT